MPSELLVSKMQKKNKQTNKQTKGHRLYFRDEACGKLPWFWRKLAHVIQHGLRGFIVKNIEGELTEANDLSHIL